MQGHHPSRIAVPGLTDTQWDAYAANISVNPNGQTVIAARYSPPAHVEVNDTMNQIALYVAKLSNDHLAARMDQRRGSLEIGYRQEPGQGSAPSYAMRNRWLHPDDHIANHG